MRSRQHHLTLLVPAVILGAAPLVLGAGENPGAADTAFFEKHIRPLLIENCYECHSAESGKSKGGLVLDHRDGLLHGGDSGASLKPGDVDASLLIQAVRYETEDMEMPPDGRLTDHEISLLEQWVAAGAPDPRTPPKASATAPRTAMTIEAGRRHWSFMPIAGVRPPDNEAPHPVDAFILEALKLKNLSPAPPADPRTFIRRVSYNLTGLPPTPQEVTDFEAEFRLQPQSAIPNLIDRLLATPQYGERWGRHWLDVARYADSNGLDENLALGTAWRYRDYVVRAFNNDLPFNRFIIEQLAGDLLPARNVEIRSQQRTATAFLNLGAKVLAEADKEKLTMDIIDEQIDTTGRAFLGMTMGCARCHDHKFDPITQPDYYAMAAIFKSTRSLNGTKRGAISQWYESPLGSLEDFGEVIAQEKQLEEKKAELKKEENTAMRDLREAAQAKAIDYLIAALELPPTPTPADAKQVAEKHSLAWPILLNCRIYLANQSQEPFFVTWANATESKDVDSLRRHYAPLFTAATEPTTEDEGEDVTLARKLITEAKGLLALPADYLPLVPKKTADQILRLKDEAELLEASLPDQPTVISVTEADEVVQRLPIHIRGSHLNLGDEVERAFPVVMRTAADHPRPLPPDQSGRLELARWIASPEHPLTARVIVNRVWQWHFGTGLVSTPDNFGILGDKPSHPELLDWLARWFTDNNWSLKALHRLILTSSTYRQSSVAFNKAQSLADPENRLLGSFPTRRLEAEEIRDSVHLLAGTLDLAVGGKTVPRRNRQFLFNHTSKDSTNYDSPRRALYLPIIRNNLYDLFQQFDHPDPASSTGKRQTSIVSPQALLLMNSEMIQDAAAAFANRLNGTTDPERLRFAYQCIFGRDPSTAEVTRDLDFLTLADSRLASSATPDSQPPTAWSLLCHALLLSNEFIWLR